MIEIFLFYRFIVINSNVTQITDILEMGFNLFLVVCSQPARPFQSNSRLNKTVN